MVEIFDNLLPISKADMWSLWVGRCLRTLVTYIAQPKSDPWWGRYLAKFRSHGTRNIWGLWGNEVDGFLLEFIWTPKFATLLGMECGLLFFLEKITLLSLADITSVPWSFDWEALCVIKWGIGIVIKGEYSWQMWMPIPEMGDWQARYLWASKWWVRGG